MARAADVCAQREELFRFGRSRLCDECIRRRRHSEIDEYPSERRCAETAGKFLHDPTACMTSSSISAITSTRASAPSKKLLTQETIRLGATSIGMGPLQPR